MHGSWREKPYLYAFGCNIAVNKDFLERNNILFDESYNGKYGMDDIDFAFRCYKSGAVFSYDAHASAVHPTGDYPSMNKLTQSMQNFDKFRKYHFVGGIVQSGPVFFEHKYNAELYRKIMGGKMVNEQDMKIKIVNAENKKLSKELGIGLPAFIIAEAGLNHNGDFQIAKKMVELAAVSGADCVKFQKRDVDQMATKHIYNNTPTPIPELGETYREVREKHELTLEEFSELKKIAEGLGLIFMITPFDLQSVEVCEKLKLDCYKIASHSMTDLPTLKKVASLRKPLFVSTGMSTPEEIDIAVKTIREYHNNFVLMHCVSSYPQKDEDTHLNMIDYLRDRYKCLVGYSGHEEGTVLTEAAVLKRAVAVERHFTLDKKMPGFDHKFSLSPQELFTMCQDIRRIERAMGIPEKKVLVSEMVARNAYRRSLVTVKPLKRGHVLNESDLTIKEPGTGVAPYKLPEVLGKKLKVDLDGDTTLEWPHLEK
jgi:sialic acid synthase SpsE